MSSNNQNTVVILYADDDEEDQMLAREAMEESRLSTPIHCVADGEELLQYLKNEGKFSDKERYPTPGIILLDLNMPRKGGIEVLKELKADPILKMIPVVILTTSRAEEDIIRTYDLGVNSFITKPVTFQALVEVMTTLSKYWFEIVKLPMAKK